MMLKAKTLGMHRVVWGCLDKKIELLDLVVGGEGVNVSCKGMIIKRGSDGHNFSDYCRNGAQLSCPGGSTGMFDPGLHTER